MKKLEPVIMLTQVIMNANDITEEVQYAFVLKQLTEDDNKLMDWWSNIEDYHEGLDIKVLCDDIIKIEEVEYKLCRLIWRWG